MTSSPTLPIALALLTLSLILSGTALAADEIYKQVDAHGNVTYSNKPIRGGKRVDLPPLSTLPAPKPAPAPRAEVRPITEPSTEQRKKELLEAISKEEKALEVATAAAKAGAEHPEVFQHTKTIIGKDGKPATLTETGRNVAAFEEKMKTLNEEVALHEKSLAALKADLANLGKNKP